MKSYDLLLIVVQSILQYLICLWSYYSLRGYALEYILGQSLLRRVRIYNLLRVDLRHLLLLLLICIYRDHLWNASLVHEIHLRGYSGHWGNSRWMLLSVKFIIKKVDLIRVELIHYISHL